MLLRPATRPWLIVQAKYWKKYAELEMAAGDSQRVKNIFSRCLLSCPNVELWQTYLSFIKQVPPRTTMDNLNACHNGLHLCMSRFKTDALPVLTLPHICTKPVILHGPLGKPAHFTPLCVAEPPSLFELLAAHIA